MAVNGIPPQLEPAIVQRVQQRQSYRQIVAWLREEHAIRVSVMAVHRLVERLRPRDERSLEDQLAEMRARIPEHRRTLEEIAKRYPEMPGVEKTLQGLRRADPRFVEAERLIARRNQLLNRWEEKRLPPVMKEEMARLLEQGRTLLADLRARFEARTSETPAQES